MDDLETALTRIDSSGTDDEPLVRPSSGRNVVPMRSTTEGSQGGGRLRRLRVVSSSLQDVGSTVLETASSEVPSHQLHPQSKHLHGPSELMDRRSSHPQFRIQEVRCELNGGRGSQGQASSGIAWMVHNRFEVLAEEDCEEGVDHHDFFGGESDTEILADPQHDEADPPVPAIPAIPVRRVVGAFAQLDVVDLTEGFERRTRIMRTVPYVMRGAYRRP